MPCFYLPLFANQFSVKYADELQDSLIGFQSIANIFNNKISHPGNLSENRSYSAKYAEEGRDFSNQTSERRKKSNGRAI